MNFITNITLDSIREAVKTCPSIREKHDFGFAFFNYQFAYPALFAGPNEMLLRECRGITFDLETGECVSRPYHKFYNLGEEKVSQPWGEDHSIMEKLDGSMVRAIATPDGMRMATRAGFTEIGDDATKFISGWEKKWLKARCMTWLDKDLTPLFEWCSRSNRVVIDHPEDRLVLTGLRCNKTGSYLDIRGDVERLAMDAAKFFSFGDMTCTKTRKSFTEHVKDLKQAEGYVVRWESGHMVKLKADEYLSLHSTLDIMKSEKTILRLIATDGIDDVIPLLRPEDVEPVRQFTAQVLSYLQGLAECIAARVELARKELADVSNKVARKQFALHYVDYLPKSASFCAWDGKDPLKELKRCLEKGSKKPDSIREELLGGLKWEPRWGQSTKEQEQSR